MSNCPTCGQIVKASQKCTECAICVECGDIQLVHFRDIKPPNKYGCWGRSMTCKCRGFRAKES